MKLHFPFAVINSNIPINNRLRRKFPLIAVGIPCVRETTSIRVHQSQLIGL